MLETICDIMSEAYKRNWITSRDGNVSIRHHDRDHFYITPSGVRKQTLQPDQFKKIKVDRCLVSGIGRLEYQYGWEVMEYTEISKNLNPSGELPMHLLLQREMGQHSHDTRVVVHVHPTYTIAAMHRGIELASLTAAFPELGRYTSVGANVGEVPPISEELGIQTAKSFKLENDGNIKHHIVGIKGHGVVAVDTSPWRAFEHIERLEHICKIVLASGVTSG